MVEMRIEVAVEINNMILRSTLRGRQLRLRSSLDNLS